MQSNALTWLEPVAAEPLASTADLLVSGGDARLALNAAGRNPYGCPPTPEPGLAAFGSSTASTVSEAGFAAAERLRAELSAELASASPGTVYARAAERIRGRLVEALGLSDLPGLAVVLAPSGTDLHRLVAHLAAAGGDGPLLSILCEAAETGSGVPAAMTAAGGEAVQVPVREPDGRLRPGGAADAEVEALADAAVAAGKRVLLVVTDVSKTGLITPGVGCALALRDRHPGRLSVLIDACQFRLSPTTLRSYLRQGFLVAVTGSKFLGGPSFSGALFAPAAAAARLKGVCLAPELGQWSSRGDWPADWSAGARLACRPNPGLLLRWAAALEHLARFRSLDEARVAGFLDRLATVVAETLWRRPELEAAGSRPLDRTALGAPDGWDARQTIFAFTLRRAGGRRLGPPEAALVQRLLRTGLIADATAPGARLRIELGQPVTVARIDGAPVAALRLSAGAPLLCEALAGEAAGEAVLSRARETLAKAAWAVDRI